MPGYELFGDEERNAVNELFELNGGVLFAHGFDDIRNGVYRVREYEQAIANKFDFRHVLAVSSGSSAVRLSLESLGIGKDDEIIIPSHTFIATAEAVLQIGAKPVVVDIDESLNMDPSAVRAAISPATKAILPVHMMGEMADMPEIMSLAREFELFVVEDCAQSLGASFGGAPAGSFGHTAAFSTDAGKTLCTGEGGFVVSKAHHHFVQSRALHDHGHAYEEGIPRGLDPAIVTGFNYRMTEIQAAIGIAQLRKLELIVDAQRTNKALFMRLLSELPVRFRSSRDEGGDIGDTVVMILESSEQASLVTNRMATLGVGTKNLPSAMRWHFAGYWNHLDLVQSQVPNGDRWKVSRDILERCVALPVGVLIGENKISEICEKVSSAVLEYV